jgi:hypothetical protein
MIEAVQRVDLGSDLRHEGVEMIRQADIDSGAVPLEREPPMRGMHENTRGDFLRDSLPKLAAISRS